MIRVQYRIRWLMAAVAVVAVLLSLPAPVLVLLVLPAVIVAAMILVPSALAPCGRRIEAACWAMALHPLAFLAWLAAWRFVLDPRTLYPRDGGWYFTMTLQAPYFLALVSRWYLPALLTIATPLGLNHRAWRRLVIPLLTMVVVWSTTWAVLNWDPFQMWYWFWD